MNTIYLLIIFIILSFSILTFFNVITIFNPTEYISEYHELTDGVIALAVMPKEMLNTVNIEKQTSTL